MSIDLCNCEDDQQELSTTSLHSENNLTSNIDNNASVPVEIPKRPKRKAAEMAEQKIAHVYNWEHLSENSGEFKAIARQIDLEFMHEQKSKKVKFEDIQMEFVVDAEEAS